jgi:hypothetical protein
MHASQAVLGAVRSIVLGILETLGSEDESINSDGGTYYHVTAAKNLEHIGKHGLIPHVGEGSSKPK